MGRAGGGYGTTYPAPLITSLNPSNDNPHWDSDIHGYAGNVTFMDGSVQQLTTPGLAKAILTSGDTNLTGCILKP